MILGRCEARTGIEPFERLVDQILVREPYRDAERLFSIVHNGSSHRAKASIQRMRQVDRRIILRHAGARQLVEPGGNLLFDHSTEGFHAERLR
jgi:hypothetical protein